MIEVFKNIKDIDVKNINVYILLKKGSGVNKKLKVCRVKADNKFNGDLLDIHIDFINEVISDEDYGEVDYCPVTKFEKGTIEKMKLDKLHNYSTIKELVNNSHNLFEGKNDNDGFEPFVYIIKFVNGDKIIYSFQHIQNQNLFKKGFWFKFNETFTGIGDEMYFLNKKFDCICIDGNDEYMKIFNKQHFDWIFGFEEMFKEEIEEHLSKYKTDENQPSFIDVDDFIDYVKNNHYGQRKMYKLIKNGNFDKYFDYKYIDIAENREKVIKFEWEGGKLKINKNNVKRLLNVLDEDYIKGIFSEEVFLSISKKSP